RGRAGRLVRLDEDAAWLERLRHAHQRSRRPEPVAEGGNAAARLLPDLTTEVIAMVRNRMRVVELVGREVARSLCELGRALDHVVDVLRSDTRPALDGLHHVKLGAERADQLEPLLREAVGDDDQTAV